MKRTAIFSAMFTAAFCAFSCQKAAESEGNGFGGVFTPVTINAVTESLEGTKSEVAYTYDLLWEEGDEIRVILNSNTSNRATFNLTSGARTKSGTFKQTEGTSLEGEVTAYYPASLLDGQHPVWPSEQTVDQKVPLYSTGTISGAEGEKLVFSSLGAVLQIVFNTSVENVTLKSIEIRDGSQRLCGRFRPTDGKAIIQNDNADSNNGVRLNLGSGTELGKGPNSFNICIPAGNYQNLTLIFTAADGRKCIMTGGKVSLERGEIGKLSLAGSKFKNYALPGEFSVGDGKKVHFSMGNLYWNGSAFKMEENQYDYPTSWNSKRVGHFNWHPDAEKACDFGSPQELKLTRDTELFTNATAETANPEFIVCSQKGLFRVLSESEWQYLLFNRTNASNLRMHPVTVCGKANCLVIAPDNWGNSGTIASEYTADEWKAASEQKGLVCLPPAGERMGEYFYSCDESANYLSNNCNDTEKPLGMVNALMIANTASDNYCGLSSFDVKASRNAFPIRLVTDVNN